MDMGRQKRQLEEEEEEDQLELRRDNKSTVQPPVNGEANGGNGHAEEEEEEAEQKKEIDHDNHNHAVELNGDEATPTSFHNNSIYFDGNQGNESSGEVSGMQHTGLDSSAFETNSKDEELHIKATEFDIHRVLSAEINYHHQKDSGGEILPCLSPSPVKETCEEKSTNFEHLDNKIGVDTDVGLIQENGGEFTEFDVEKVLEKQSTHELYCPNCHSCITRRVILRRKKPKVPKIRHKPKHDKSEARPAPAGGTVNAGNDQHDDTLIFRSSGSPIPAADGENLDRQPEIFRCLSCFSFFIPTGNAIKLFCLSRASNDTGEMQDVQNLPPSEKNWLLPFLASDKGKPAIVQGNRAPQDSEVVGIRAPAKDGYVKSQQGGLESLNLLTSLEKPLPRIDQETNVPLRDKTRVDHNGFDLSIQAASSENESSTSDGPVNSTTIRPQETRKGAPTSSVEEHIPLNGVLSDVGVKLDSLVDKNNSGNDLTVIIQTPTVQPTSSQWAPNVDISVHAGISSQAQINVGQNTGVATSEVHQWDILKSVVYGGLLESITSLGVVSSAAAAGAATLDVLAMGLANLMGGLFIIFHNVRELKYNRSGESTTNMNQLEDRYQQLLGRRENFALHATVVVLSYLIFGILPPVIYGFSFRKSDNRDLKIVAVVGSSLACIILLAVGKARIQNPPRSYFRTILYYVTIGLTASALSFVVGDQMKKLFKQLNLFEPASDITMPYLESNSMKPGWASY